MDRSKILMAMFMALVMSITPITLLFDDSEAFSVTVGSGVVVEGISSPSYDMLTDDGTVWATVIIETDAEIGKTMTGFSVTPKVELKQGVWNGGTSKDDCDIIEMQYSEYYHGDMSASSTYRPVYLNESSVGDTVSFETFTYNAFGDRGIISTEMNRIVYTFKLVNSETDPVFASDTVSVTITMFSGSTFEYTTEVKYDINGGVGGPTTSTVVTATYPENMVTVPVTLSNVSDMRKDGCLFMGWAPSVSSSTVYGPGETYNAVAGDVTTLYAIWQKSTVEITLMDGDTVLNTVSVEIGKVPSIPSDPVKEGYTFLGWYEDPDLNTGWDPSATVSSDKTLYAGWKEKLAFTTVPKASIDVVKLSASEYRFDARSSENYETSAMSTTWSVMLNGEEVYTHSGPVMDYTFMEYGSYQIVLTIENSDNVSDTCTTTIDLREPAEEPTGTPAIIFPVIMGFLCLLLIVRVLA